MPDANDSTAATACAHHWMLETPVGDVTRGACKRCGAVRTFNDYDEKRPPRFNRSDRRGVLGKQPSPRNPE